MKRIIFFALVFSILAAAASASSNKIPASSPPRKITVRQDGLTIKITWKKPRSSNVQGFRIYRSQQQKKPGALIKELSKKARGFRDETVAPDSPYYYTVRTLSIGGGESKNRKQYRGYLSTESASDTVNLPSFYIVETAFCGNGIIEGSETCDNSFNCESDCSDYFYQRVATKGSASCLNEKTFDGVVRLKNGASCLYSIQNKTYEILLDHFVSNAPVYVIQWTDGSIATPPLIGGNTGFFTVDNAFTIRPAVPSNQASNFSSDITIHKIIPASKVEFVSNCRAISNAEVRNRCEQWIKNNREKTAVALEKLSGRSLGGCLNRVVYEFTEKDLGGGRSAMEGTDGKITFDLPTLKGILERPDDELFEIHELMHLSDYCLNIPTEESHTFFAPRQAEISAVADSLSRFGEHFWQAKSFFETTQKNPASLESDVEYPEDRYAGCSGIKEFLLAENYMQNRLLLKAFYKEILAFQPQLASEQEGAHLRTYNAIVARILGNTPEIISQINKYCRSYPLL